MIITIIIIIIKRIFIQDIILQQVRTAVINECLVEQTMLLGDSGPAYIHTYKDLFYNVGPVKLRRADLVLQKYYTNII